MNHFSKKAALITAIVVPFTFGAAAASAAQITDWGYNVDNSFTDTDYTDGDGVIVETDNSLSWGEEGGPRSSISINDIDNADGSAGVLETNGPDVAGGTFEHNNQAIPASNQSLLSFDLTSTLQLFALAPAEMAGEQPDDISITFESFFTETFNGGDCFDGSNSTCDDIFTLGNPEFGEVNAEGNFEVAAPSFTIDDFSYTVFLEIVNLTDLSDEACGIANAPASCIGFLTQEGQTSEFQSNFRIESSAVEVPEPGSLALLGLGLVGLGVASRRK